MYQTRVGDKLLTGSAFDDCSGGVKAELIAGSTTLSAVHQQTGSEASYQNPYSSWAGCTNMIVKAFNLAGMGAWPSWAQLSWLRGRAANVDMGSDGDLQDYRIIINYDWKFQQSAVCVASIASSMSADVHGAAGVMLSRCCSTG